MFPSYIAKKWSSYVSYSINMKSVPSLVSVFVFEGIFLPSPMIPRQIQFCVCNLHILKGKWLPFQMIYVDCPRCTSESSDSPSNYRCFWESKSKVAYWNILAFAYDFREFWAYRVCAQTTHIILSNTILRRSVKLSKTLTIFTSLCV